MSEQHNMFSFGSHLLECDTSIVLGHVWMVLDDINHLNFTFIVDTSEDSFFLETCINLSFIPLELTSLS